MNTILSLNNVYAGYEESTILYDVDLNVYEDDFLGIIGPNGGGKTTLLKVILGLLNPQKGNVIWNGKKGKRNGVKIGYLPQIKNFDSFFPIKVIDTVLSGLMAKRNLFSRFSSDEKDIAYDMLKRFAMDSFSQHTIGELSGGQIQRVFLARALVSDPQLLILDEPDTFIDNSSSVNLNEMLTELNKTKAIIMVSHDIGSVLSSVKNIACVNKNLHYHSADECTHDLLTEYQCSFRLVGHGDVPHTVLKKHGDHND
jgi:zinc transport system ATP-binding protein